MIEAIKIFILLSVSMLALMLIIAVASFTGKWLSQENCQAHRTDNNINPIWCK
jgi:hypothetical protein